MATETKIPDAKPLIIVGLKVSNIKRIKAVEIVPNDPNWVEVTGFNDQGKTSTLDAIEWNLGGAKGIQERPLRDGTTKGYIICDLGDIIVQRTFNARGSSELTIHDKSGVKYSSPQAVLDSLYQRIAFDPLAFTRLKKEEKRDLLRKLVNIDFTQLDVEKQEKFTTRTDVNRRLQEQRARLGGYPKDPTAPEKETSTAELLAELDKVQKHNRGVSDLEEATGACKRVAETTKSGVRDIEKAIEALKAQIVELEQEREKAITVANKADQEFQTALSTSSNAKRVDEAPIRERLANLDESNRKVRCNREHDNIKTVVEALHAESEKLTHRLDEIENTKVKMMKEAKFPLKGLSFDETGVTLNGVPFEQGSQARQLQAAVAIGLALNPRIRVILIRDASLLDDKSKEMMKQMAVENQAQVWAEVVQSDDPMAIVIEDGMVKEGSGLLR